MLVKLPNDRTFTLTEFVNLQQELVNSKAGKLQGMNVQIEAAVEDMITLVKSYPLNPAIEGMCFVKYSFVNTTNQFFFSKVSISHQYNNFFFQSVLDPFPSPSHDSISIQIKTFFK